MVKPQPFAVHSFIPSITLADAYIGNELQGNYASGIGPDTCRPTWVLELECRPRHFRLQLACSLPTGVSRDSFAGYECWVLEIYVGILEI